MRLVCPPSSAARSSLAWPLLVAALAVGTSACRETPSDAIEVTVIADGPLVLGEPVAPAADEAQSVLRLSIAQGLVRFDAAGQVVPGLAERWNVSDDGLSYIFRIEAGEWPDGRKFMARDVARILKRQLRATKDSAVREALGAVVDVVAMTDRVIEIQLSAPRPHLLELLAHPDFALIHEGTGSGPFQRRPDKLTEAGDGKPEIGEQGDAPPLPVMLTRRAMGIDGDVPEREEIELRARAAPAAIGAFQRGETDLVLGGTIGDLPLVTGLRLPRGALRFDPAIGLFGLVPARADGPLSEPDVRALLDRAIDRPALIAALAIPGLGPRATLLQAGLAGIAEPVQPAWLAQPIEERRPLLQSEAQRLFGETDRPTLRIALPDGPGDELVLARLIADWGALGIKVERVAEGSRPDLRWVDAVAPSTSAAWFLRSFRCAVVPICVAEADTLLEQARLAPNAAQRRQLLTDAATMMDAASLFFSIAAPIRWSLVGDRVPGYQVNSFARHPLADLGQRVPRGF